MVLARRALLAAALLFVVPGHARALEAFDGRIQLHGSLSEDLRIISNGYRIRDHNWFLSKMATKLSLELEVELFPDGIGPFDIVDFFARVDVQYDCVYNNACNMAPQWNYFGDNNRRFPENLANGRSSGLAGAQPNPLLPVTSVQPDHRLVTFSEVPPADTLLRLGNPEALQNTFFPLLDAKFSTKYIRGSISPQILGLGPVNPDSFVDATGSLAGVASPTPARPLRPATDDLFTPSYALQKARSDYGNLDQNFTEQELAWNRGASQQQTKELKEAYLDITMLDGRLQLRLGKQITRWGKTELFRSQDQLNPQDLAISNLPSFEESLIGLWQARAIYSFYEVGPFEDVRLELVANLDHFEPADLGDCAEPYTVALICQLSQGAFAHGFAQIGISGRKTPQVFYDRFSGLEFGARLEFRVGRFSVAITDFYGYEDFPTTDFFNEFSRSVDPMTGRPLDVFGNVLDPDTASPEYVTNFHTGNRQLYDVICSATLGFEIGGDGAIANVLGPALDNACAIGVFGETTDLLGLPGLTLPGLLGLGLQGAPAFAAIFNGFCPPATPNCAAQTAPLRVDPGDNYLGTTGLGLNDGLLSSVMTVQQEALLGCGPHYYGADDGFVFSQNLGVAAFAGSCSSLGLDLFNAEASVLFQRWHQNESGGLPGQVPVATRWIPGIGTITLPGARSPFTFFQDPVGFRYDPRVDGCVVDLNQIYTPAQVAQIPNAADCVGSNVRLRNDAGVLLPAMTPAEIQLRFPNELAVLSENFLKVLVSVAQLIDPAAGCSYGPSASLGNLDSITRCDFVNSLFSAAGAQRPELTAGGNGRFGRRDFAWLGGSQIQLFHERRNVLGVAVDFAEDYTKTSWGIELTWFEDQPYVNTREDRGFSLEDTINLVVSVDRPTFINFLNANRTVFFNAQLFLRYIPKYEDRDTFLVDGPVSALATLTAFTGFWQDRLMTFLTFVHEVESNSGGQIFSISYRYSESFSLTVGLTSFYGSPSRFRWPNRPPVARGQGADYTQRSNFRGVSAIAERDEIFFSLRKTF